MFGGEVDAHHGAQLQINEQQENVLDPGMSPGSHIEECEDGGPNDGCADCKEREDVKSIHHCRSDLVGNALGLVSELFEPIRSAVHR